MITPLPTLRSRILRSFLVLIALYAFLGFLLVASVFISSSTTPKLLHRNYDSTAAADRMRRAWDAFTNLKSHTEHSADAWADLFESALHFEESNITEPGEEVAVIEIRKLWNSVKAKPTLASPEVIASMHRQLDSIVRINEGAMFQLAHANQTLSQKVLMGALGYFVLTLIFAIFFANGLADRLAQPLKQIAEILRGKSKLGRELKLPQPTSLEVLILNHELKRLWKRLSEANEFKVVELLQQKKKLETVLTSIEDALIVINPEGIVTQCNDYFAKLVNVGSPIIIGQIWRDLPSIHENYISLRGQLSESMPESKELELNLDGHKRIYAARWRHIEPVKGQITGIVYLLHDITEKRQRYKLRAEIIDLLSHELKTPLQSLGTASELLLKQRQDFSDETKLLIDTVSEDVDRIRAVADEFVQVTQTQSKFLKLKFERLALSQALPEWLKPFSVVARDRKVKIEFTSESDDAIWANVDSIKFPWVISNLVSNAIRFSPPNSSVKVKLSSHPNAVLIDVEDDGPGIAAQDKAKIFEPFFQSTGTTSGIGRGLLGVGLTIAKEVVEAHEGKIECLSKNPQGSVFRITLPVPL